MTFNASGKILGRKNINMFEAAYIKVQNTSTAVTDKMIVRIWIPVKTVGADPGGKLLDFADFRKQRQIPVHSAEADIRKFFLNIQIYGFCGRVVITGNKEILNGFPLSAVFQHKYHPFINNRNCY